MKTRLLNPTLHSSKKQKGLTILETVFVLLAILAIFGFVIYYAYKMYQRQTTLKELTGVAQLAEDVKNVFQSQGDFGILNNALLVNKRKVPESMLSGAAIINHYGGTITLAPATRATVNDSFSITSTNYPQEACNTVTETLHNLFLRVTVNGVAVKNFGDTNINQATLAGACNDADTNTIVFVKQKT